MNAQDYKFTYTANPFDTGTVLQIGGNSANQIISGRHVKHVSYNRVYFSVEFWCVAGNYSALAGAIQVLESALRFPRGRLVITIGASTECDWNPDITAAESGNSFLVYDIACSVSKDDKEPDNGEIRVCTITLTGSRPSNLTGQNGRQVNALVGLQYKVETRQEVSFGGEWTAVPGSPGKMALPAYNDTTATKGVENYAQTWLAANATLVSGAEWVCVSHKEIPSDSGYSLQYARVYFECIGGRHEIGCNIVTSAAGRVFAKFSGTYCRTTSGAGKTALQNFTDNTNGVDAICTAFLTGAGGLYPNTIYFEAVQTGPLSTSKNAHYAIEEKKEFLTFTALYKQLTRKQSALAVNNDDLVIVDDEITYEIIKYNPGFSPDLLSVGPSVVPSSNGQAGSNEPVRTGNRATGAANGLTGQSTSQGGGSGQDITAAPFLEIIIKSKKPMSFAALNGQQAKFYYDNNCKQFDILDMQTLYGIVVIAVESTSARYDPINSVLLGEIRGKVDPGTTCLSATLDTMTAFTKGRRFPPVIGGKPHQYAIQYKYVRGIKERKCSASFIAGRVNANALILDDHQDPAGGTWYQLDEPKITIRNYVVGDSNSVNVTYVGVAQVFIYVLENIVDASVGHSRTEA